MAEKKKKAGRPEIEIDKRLFESLCEIHCTLSDMTGPLHCSEDTIERWCKRTYTDDKGEPMNFADVYKQYSALGNASLRRTQFKLAEKSPAMAIFLGKQYLGQKDQPEVVVNTGGLEDAMEEAFKLNHPDEYKGDDDV